MSSFSTDFLDRLREQVDILALLSERMKLRRSGTEWKGLCPFHKEKTPSFAVNVQKGLYHCFGCRESGDAIRFIEKTEGLSFPEAVRWLAQWADIEVEEDGQRDPERARLREESTRMLHLVRFVAKWHMEQLPKSPRALELLGERGITVEEAERWNIGVAPADRRLLPEALRAQKVSPADAEKAGMILLHPSRPTVAYLHDRLVFPATNTRGAVVAFTGRRLCPDEEAGEDTPKWMHTPTTPLWQKNHCLFGLSRAAQTLAEGGVANLVEGPFDVTACHRVELVNTVATYGCSLSLEQALALRRAKVHTVVFAWDADKAGAKGVRASAHLAMQAHLDVRVARLPGKDPDALLRAKGGVKRLREALLERTLWWGEWEAARIGEAEPLLRPRMLRAMAPLLRTRSSVEVEKTLEALTHYADLSEDVVRATLREGLADQQETEDMRARVARQARRTT